ncbi:uncharacterized protein OCT59_015178 [Rhizophagus irregularis]|uniref:uncharacterized protein n=1 Tax=Rhizophagus irregularis TaxID=588596 RepID=UPI000CBDF151|nr:hypothetical protein OCT59_015178 [Rhizophagus irregularis]GBC19012.1 hypothetical protein RIR_jg6364.t1 [Rhizophagus irregularis DAOM 181602=DAOM 197198]
MANNNISLKFRISENGSGDFTLHNINPQTTTVRTLRTTIRNGGHVTFANFKLYRGNIAKEVKEHMNPSSYISEYFSVTPDLNKVVVYIRET